MQRTIRKRMIYIFVWFAIAIGLAAAVGGLTSSHASAADTVADEKWVNYTKLDSTSCKITKFNYVAGVSPTEIIIPKEIQGLTVKEIGDGAFAGCNITKLTFASGSKVHTIGEGAFMGNAIADLDLPKTVSTLKKECFKGIAITSLDLSGLTALDILGESAFQDCTALRTLKLPESLETIEDGCFQKAPLSGTVTIPESVNEIGFMTFRGVVCTFDLKKHEPGTIPNAPWGSGRAKLEWSDKNQDKTTNTVFKFDKVQGLIYGIKPDAASKDYADWNRSTGALIIPAQIGGKPVTGIDGGALSYNDNLLNPSFSLSVKSITFGNGHTLEKIPGWTFSAIFTPDGFTVKLPPSVKEIGKRAFIGTTVRSIDMPGVTSVDVYALNNCKKLQQVTFGSDAVQYIHSGAFLGSNNINAINLRQMTVDSVSGAPWSAEGAVVNWKNNQVTPASTIVDITGKWRYNPEKGSIVQYYGEDGPDVDLEVPAELKDRNGKTTKIIEVAERLIEYERKVFKSLIIGNGIKRVHGAAFRGNQIGEIVLPDSIITIGWSAFENTGAVIRNGKMPEEIRNIEANVFYGCTFDEGRLIVPGRIDNLHSDAFSGTQGITSILIKQYKNQVSDGVYDDANGKYLAAETGVTGGSPFGVPNAVIHYMDDPRPTPKYTVQNDATANKAIVKVQGYTNNDFYIVKNMTSASGQPALTGDAYPTANGKENPATADLVISSKTANNIRGGNGDYNLTYVYGNQGDETDRKNYQDKVTVNAFHTITYNANAGGKAVSGAVPSQGDSYVNGAKATIKGKNTLAITGYTFKGWNTKPDGTGTNYNENSQMTMGTVNVTLYAKWEINNVTVTLNGNGGTFGSATTKAVTGNYGTQITAASGYAAPQKTGSSFIGWATTNNATAANVFTMPAANATYYAVWKVGGVAITLDGNGGTVNGNATYVIAGNTGTAMNLPAESAMKRDGYTFNGWFDAKTGGKRITATTFPASNGTYYAQWNAKDNTVRFAAATGGKATTGQRTVKSGNKVGVTPAATANGGYTFTGYWNCSEGGTYTSAEVNNYVISGKNATVTFTAQFVVNGSSTIIYDCQGGVTAQGESLRVYSKPAGTDFTEELPVPVRAGYTYTWSQSRPDAYPAAGEVTIVDAVWAPAKIEVLFKVSGAGGTVTPSKVMVDAGSPVGIIPTLTPADTATMKYTPSNVWKVSEGGEVTTQGIKNYVISGKNATVTFTTTFNGEKKPTPPVPPVNPPGGDEGGGGTPSTPAVEKTEKQMDTLILKLKNDGDIKGSSFSGLQAKGVAKGKKYVKLTWKKVKGATKYVIYGNRCGIKNKYKKFKTTKGKTLTVKKIKKTKLKKGKYYKFIIVAYGKNTKGKIVTKSISKTIHVCTNGGKKGNYKSVKIKKPAKAKMTIKKGKTYTIKGKQVRGKKKVAKHRGLAFETTNSKVATVTKKGKVKGKGKGKGSCYIYAYAQNGVFKRVKVTVKL